MIYLYITMSELSQSTRKIFVENVQKWVLYDQQLKSIQEKTKTMRLAKRELSDSICKYMIENGLEKNKIKLSNGEMRIGEKKEYSTLTFSYIEECLAKIIPEKDHVDFIIEYLKSHREIKTVQELQRTVL
jgi:hypothetical protein